MYIHQQHDWPSLHWNELLISNKLAIVNKAAGMLMGKLSAIGFGDQLSAVVVTLSNNIVESSIIEGVNLDSAQVRSSVARKLGVTLPNEVPSSHYIEGIVEMTMDATVHYNEPLTTKRLFGWHCALFPNGRSGCEQIDVGQYRKGEMRVVSGLLTREKTHYVAPSPDRIEEEMNRFLEWYNSDGDVTYLKSALAHFWFVCIHPFDDGNGRIGRAVSDMALAQADNSPLRFFSMSRQISKSKRKYYEILEQSQKSACDITPWMEWYLSCMLDAIKDSDNMLSQVLNKSVFWQTHAQSGITLRQRDVLNIYLDGAINKVTAKNWAKFAKVSLDTAARDVKELVQKGILLPQPGRTRDVNYGIVCGEGRIIVPGNE